MTVHPIPLGDDGQIDRVAWLTLRQELRATGLFSASSAGVLWDCHPFLTLGDVATQHIAPAPIDDRPNEAMRRGHFLEPALLRWFEDQIGMLVISPPVMYAENGVLATLDGEIVGAPDQIVEAKSYAGYIDGDVLPYWRAQAVAQCLAKPQVRTVHFAVIDSSLRFQHVPVTPTTSELDDMAERVRRFLAFVAMGCVPEGVDLSERNVKDLWPVVEPEATVDLTYDQLGEVRSWAGWREQRLNAEKEEASAKDAVAHVMRDNAVAKFAGVPVATFKSGGNGRVLRPTKHVFDEQLDEVERGERKVVV